MTINKVIVLKSCRVAPPSTSVPELSHSLCFSDMLWIGFPPVQKLLFYETPVSKSHFIDTMIPHLKKSLSLALKQFPSLAGNMFIHSDYSKTPEIQFTEGDSISIVFAESTFQDFEFLMSNQPKDCNELYPLVPQLPTSTKSGEERKVPLLALQVTLFPGNGICIGIANQHVAADGRSMLAFVNAWATISKLGEDYEKLKGVAVSPIYDRGVLGDLTKKLDDMVWKRLASNKTDDKDMFESYHPQDIDKLRSTFVVGREESERLKRVISSCSAIKHLSTFTVVCGYVWTCMVKAENALKEVDENEMDFFNCVADFRLRVDPPIPTNYFGNCLAPCFTSVKSRELSHGGDELARATELIGEAIQNRLENKEGIFGSLENMYEEAELINQSRVLGISGSPRLNYYNVDFGWGKTRKYEVTSVDSSGTISLCGCRGDSGGIEIGVVLPRNKMDAFAKYFREGLNNHANA